MNHPTFNNQSKRGFTLVEILVVLVIATVVLSIAIPKIRTVNKERNLREAARVVGSIFSNASQRAVIDGVAGVRISRNARFVQSGYQFAATEVSLLRKVPNYTGDQQNAQITGSSDTAGTVTIPAPFEQDALEIIKVGDYISFGNSSYKYRITGPATIPTTGSINLELYRGEGDYMPIPPFDASSTNNPTYVIYRQPRVLKSSTTKLPDNYIVDLRFSGFLVLNGGQLTTVFDPTQVDTDIDFVFDEDGTLDRVFYQGAAVTTQAPLGPLYFFITESPDSYEIDKPVALNDASSLWVTVSNSTGTANIGYNDGTPSDGQTYDSMSTMYSSDRAGFNTIMNDSREGSISTSATQ